MLTLCVDEKIAAQLAKDRRAVAIEPERDFRRGHCRATPARDLATIFETRIQMQTRGGHENSSLMQDADLTTKSQFKLEPTQMVAQNTRIITMLPDPPSPVSLPFEFGRI